MPKLYGARDVIKGLRRAGFEIVNQKGSHIKYRKYGDSVLTAVVPANKREIPIGTFRSILRQSKLIDIDFK